MGGLAFNEQYACTLNDLTVYTLNIAQKDDKTYAVCKAEFTGQRPKGVEKDESPEELKKKEALLLAFDNAAAFTARHKGWIYEIPDWKAKNLTKKLPDLLEDVEKPKDPNAAEAAAPTPAKQAPIKPVQATAPEPVKATAPEPVRATAPDPVKVAKPAEPNKPAVVVPELPAEPKPVAPDGAKVDDPNAPKQ